MKTLSRQAITDILTGCALLGTGGGGSLKEGLAMMQADFDANLPLRLIPLAELDDDALIATPYGCGAPAADNEIADDTAATSETAIMAFQTLAAHLEQDFAAVSSTELGGANTAEALHVACQLGLPLVDADPVGRSVPELQHSTYFVHNIPITPLAVSTTFGDNVIVKDAADDFRAEAIVRAIAVASGDLVGVTDHPVSGKVAKKTLIPNAISDAQKIGELLRAASENHQSAETTAVQIAEQMNGHVAFSGTVNEFPWQLDGGFNIGDIHLSGQGEFAGQNYRLYFQNEVLVAYRNGIVDASVPDLICLLDGQGQPVTLPNLSVGEALTVLILPAPSIWKTPAGLDCLGPRSFGFDFDYHPYGEQ